MIDICTVVFRDELNILKLQAQSVGMYCQNIGVRNIYVVINDDDMLQQEIDPQWWGAMAGHVLIVPRTTFSAEWVDNGWLTQQLWKMLVPAMSYNVYTMVLDAKTIIVKPMVLTDLVNYLGQVRTGMLPVFDVFRPAKDITDQLFQQDLQEQIGPGGVPFFFHNDTMRFMISDLTFMTRRSFPKWFQDQGKLTEFMLYSAYVLRKWNTLESFYSREQANFPVNICHSQVDRVDQLLDQMADPQTTAISVHRDAWTAMTDAQRQRYRLLLIDRGIIEAWKL